MTFATLVFIFVGKRITLKDRLVLQEVYADSNLTGLLKLTQNIMALTFLIEFLGAFVLSMFFIPRYGYLNGIWLSVFHAVSAFCNAGFDILGGGVGLTMFYSDPLILITVAMLVIIGGLGFGVLLDIIRVSKKERLHLQQNTKAVLGISAVLLALGWVLFFIFEYNNPLTLGQMSFFDKVLNSFFQSVMPRTAGFSSISQSGLSHASVSLTEFFMFVGASPASTGGGIKTTTLLIIIMIFVAGAKSEEEVLLGGKKIANNICFKAVATVFLAMMVICFVTTLVFTIELAHGNNAVSLTDIIFEVISAFGTVGLSRGVTATLSNPSLVILSVVMLVGRLGTLCLSLIFIRGNKKNHLNIKHPSAKLVI